MNLLLCLSIVAAVVVIWCTLPAPGHAPGGLLFVCKRALHAPPMALRARVGDHLQIAIQPTKKAPPCPSLATTTACAFRK